MTSVRRPWLALMAARLQVMVDLPTPPFWLNTTRGMGDSLCCKLETVIVPFCSGKTFPYNQQRRAFPHGKAANRVRWGTKQP